jgi:protein-L-isoaspartate(D-aspartate) O-methyltransferase
MLSSKLFPWKKNKKKRTIYKNEKNEELIQELRFEGITDEKILSSIRIIPRELFAEKLDEAYENKALSTDCGQTITQPFCTAFMISCLNLKKTDNVLEIGTGIGWATAIISKLVKTVFTIERFNKLLDKAKKNIAKLNIKNINYKLGNGFEGWPEEISFDAIIIGAASEVIPIKLLESLKSNGRLVMPKKYEAGNQKLLLVTKKSGNFEQKELLDVKFVPLLNEASVK